MSALMSDLAQGLVDPTKGNAICNAGGKLLRAVEMTYRFGKQKGDESPTLILVR